MSVVMDLDLKNKVALVTGASQGLGKAMSLLLATVLLGASYLSEFTKVGQDLEGQMISVGVSTLAGTILMAVALIFSTAMFRCMGIFGLANPTVLVNLPSMTKAPSMGSPVVPSRILP